jgi:hypothetical protein
VSQHVLVIGSDVATPDPVPGCTIDRCQRCGRHVLLSPSSVAVLADHGALAVVVCGECGDRLVGPADQYVVSRRQAEELVEALGYDEADELVQAVTGHPIMFWLDGRAP